MECGALLALLNLSDGSLPIGRFAHSTGVEPLHMAGLLSGDEALGDYVTAHLLYSAAPLDGAAAFWAHTYYSQHGLERLRELDRTVSSRKLCSSARAASISCGREFARLLMKTARLSDLTRVLTEILADPEGGNLSVTTGAASAALGIRAPDCVLMEMRSTCAGMLSAGVRLGLTSAARAQVILFNLAEPLARACAIAQNTSVEDMGCGLPDIEAFLLQHKRIQARNFGS